VRAFSAAYRDHEPGRRHRDASFEKISGIAATRRNFISTNRRIEFAIREECADRGTRLVKELERVKKRLTAVSARRTPKDNTLNA